MKRIIPLLLVAAFLLCLSACKKEPAFSSVDNLSSSSSRVGTSSDTSSVRYYPDAKKDFTGKITIVGYWHCISSTDPDGVVTDESANEEYYLFESDGNMQNFYQDELFVDYEGYKFTESYSDSNRKEGTLSISYGNTTIVLNCKIEEKRLILSTNNSNGRNFMSVYERVKFPESK